MKSVRIRHSCYVRGCRKTTEGKKLVLTFGQHEDKYAHISLVSRHEMDSFPLLVYIRGDRTNCSNHLVYFKGNKIYLHQKSMEDPGRMELRHWPHFDQNHMKDYLKDHPALRLMETLAQRDAAIAERDTAMAEKKTAFAERDAALLQRDVAYADRNTAWMERDTALAALTMLRANKDNSEAAAKLMHMVNINVNGPFVEPVVALPPAEGMPGGSAGAKKQPGKKKQEGGAKKRKRPPKESSQRRRGSKSAQKEEMQPQIPSDAMFKSEGNLEELPRTSFADAPPYDLMLSMPIPYCSCTGGNQQCYRWGNGGWQSACCTNVLCMYPLPMSPTKRGARVPGRKMSGGAFKKILEKLAAEGVDVTVPVDLKNHWAKHGTNRYVTIK